MRPPKDFLDLCPGLWYGNNPSPELGYHGNCTVATDMIAQAIDWLRRKRAAVLSTNVGPYYATTTVDRGVMISFVVKPARTKGV